MFGTLLYFPGISPITMDVWKNSDNKEKAKKQEEYANNPVFNYVTDKDGRPTGMYSPYPDQNSEKTAFQVDH